MAFGFGLGENVLYTVPPFHFLLTLLPLSYLLPTPFHHPRGPARLQGEADEGSAFRHSLEEMSHG